MASRALGVLTLDLAVKIGAFENGMDRAARTANKRLSEIEKRAFAFGKVLGGALATGAAAALAGLITVTKQAIDSADRLNDISQRLGVGTEALSAWGYAAQQSGTDIEALNVGLTKLTKNVAAAADSTSKQGKLFASLGISVKDAAGNLRSVEDLVPEIAQAFKALNNETLEAALAQELFGKSGANLLQFLNLGADGLSEMEEKARSLGIVISQQTAQAADDFNDELANLKASFSGLGVQISGALLPALTDTVRRFTDLVSKGELASNTVTVLDAAMSAAVGTLEAYNQLVRRTSIAIEVLAESTQGLLEVQHNVATVGFGEGSIADGFKRIKDAYTNGQKDLDALIAEDSPQNKVRKSIEAQIKAAMAPLQKQAALPSSAEAALNKLLAGEDKPSRANKERKAGLTEEQKKADELKRAYESLNAQLNEQIDLLGKEGEAAKVAYETQHGALVGLTQAQKDQVIALAESLDIKREELELEKELKKEHDRRQEQAQSVLDAIHEEREALGLSAEQWEIYNNVKQAGANASKENIAAIIAETKALQEERKALEPQIAIMDEFRSSLEDSVVDVINGGKSIKDAFKDLFDDIAAQITRWIAQRWIEQAFGGMGTTGQGSAGGWFGAALGALFGGGRAAGGMVLPGQFYRINENGPEMLSMGGRDYLMMGSQAGRVIPNNNSRSNSYGPTNIYVQGSATRETIKQIDRANGRRSRRELGRTGA